MFKPKNESDTNERLKVLEAAVNDEAIDALSTSLRGIIEKHDNAHRDVVNILAHEAMKSVLASFPKHAQDYVLGVFNARGGEFKKFGCALGSRYDLHIGAEKEPNDFSDILFPQTKDNP